MELAAPAGAVTSPHAGMRGGGGHFHGGGAAAAAGGGGGLPCTPAGGAAGGGAAAHRGHGHSSDGDICGASCGAGGGGGGARGDDCGPGGGGGGGAGGRYAGAYGGGRYDGGAGGSGGGGMPGWSSADEELKVRWCGCDVQFGCLPLTLRFLCFKQDNGHVYISLTAQGAWDMPFFVLFKTRTRLATTTIATTATVSTVPTNPSPGSPDGLQAGRHRRRVQPPVGQSAGQPATVL